MSTILTQDVYQKEAFKLVQCLNVPNLSVEISGSSCTKLLCVLGLPAVWSVRRFQAPECDHFRFCDNSLKTQFIDP